MGKLYAAVQPAYTFVGDVFYDFPYPVIALAHLFHYERVCGYSLGHQADFYSSLDEAKRRCFHSDSAIIELSVEQDQVTGFCKAYLPGLIQEKYKPYKNGNFFEKVYHKQWNEQLIQSSDVSKNALEEINRQYQLQHNIVPSSVQYYRK